MNPKMHQFKNPKGKKMNNTPLKIVQVTSMKWGVGEFEQFEKIFGLKIYISPTQAGRMIIANREMTEEEFNAAVVQKPISYNPNFYRAIAK